MDQNEANDRAARGAALLDEKRPEWLGLMNVDTLDVQSLDDCPIGQAWPDRVFTASVRELFDWPGEGCMCRFCRPIVDQHGFDTPAGIDGYDQLTAAWKALIQARRDVVAQQLAEAGWLLSRDSLTMLSPVGETHEIAAEIILA